MKTIYTLFIIVLVTSTAIAQQTSKTINHDGLTRKFIEYVPAIYNQTEAVPLVICLHGLGDNMTNFYGIGMNYIADTANFIVLTPEAEVDNQITGSTAWNSGASAYGFVLNGNVDDVGFITSLIDTTSKLYNIDTNRIYVMGFSMGGFMTQRLACEMNDVFAAVASVSGTQGTAMTCTNDNPIPVCHIHGTLDSTIYYTNNMYGNDAEEVVNFWVNKNGCDTQADTVSMPDNAPDGKTVQKITYPNGSFNTEVVFYKIINGEHEWLYQPNNDISYIIEIWKFFSKYTKQTTNIISDKYLDVEIKLYPNPTKNKIVYVSGNNIDIKTINIIDFSGRTVKQIHVNTNTNKFNLHDIDSGIYIIEIVTKTGIYSQKLILE